MTEADWWNVFYVMGMTFICVYAITRMWLNENI